jgi:hypothetical protein
MWKLRTGVAVQFEVLSKLRGCCHCRRGCSDELTKDVLYLVRFGKSGRYQILRRLRQTCRGPIGGWILLKLGVEAILCRTTARTAGRLLKQAPVSVGLVVRLLRVLNRRRKRRQNLTKGRQFSIHRSPLVQLRRRRTTVRLPQIPNRGVPRSFGAR